MPYDEDGNLIPEEDDPEGSAVETQSPNFNADIAEYIRRQGLQSQMASSGGGSSVATMPSPATIGPEEEKYRKLEKQTPLKQNFHPSKLRSVLSTAAGIGTGIIFGPNAGQHVYDIARNSQYNHAQGDFQQKLGVQEAAAKEEEAATQRSAVQAHLGAQSAAEVERAKTMQANARAAGALRDYRVYQTSDLAHQRKMDELRVQHGIKADTLWDVVDDSGKHHVANQAQNGEFTDSATKTVIPPEHVDASKTRKLGVGTTNANEPLVPVQEGKEVVYRKRSESEGKQAPKTADEVAAAQRNSELQAERAQNHLDKSYQFHTIELDKIQKPISDYTARLSRLEDTLHSNNIVGDTLFGPELLSVMAGGQGSGVRMNEAELDRIFHSRTAEDSFKVWLTTLSTDPKNATAISPAQRQQASELIKAVRKKINDKNAAISEAGNEILSAKDENGHRVALNKLKQKVNVIDSASSINDNQAPVATKRYNPSTGKIENK